MAGDSIPKSIITSPDGLLIPPSEFSTPDQTAVLQHPGKCDLLSIIHHKEFRRTQDRSYLDNAVFCCTKAVEVCPPEDPLRKKYHFRLGNYLASRGDRYGEAADVEAAIKVLEESLREDDDDQGNLEGHLRGKALTSLGRCHRLKFLATGSQTDFERALEDSENIIALYDDLGDGEKVADAERVVALMYEDKFAKAPEDTEALDDAVSWAERAVETSEGLTLWTTCKENLAGLYERRYGVSLDEDDLLAAIQTWEDLFVEGGPPSLKAAYQFQLARLYLRLTKVTMSPNDGSEASSNIAAALRNTRADDPARPERLRLRQEIFEFLSTSDVGFDVRGRTTNAEIAAQKKEIEYCASEGNAAGQAELLRDLAMMYYGRYQSAEALRELVASKDTMRTAIEVTPEDDEQNTAIRLRTAAFICCELFRETDDVEHLDDGIQWGRRAVEICERSADLQNSVKALISHTFGRTLHTKIDEEGPVSDAMIAEAMGAYERSVDWMSEYCSQEDDCEHCRDRKMYRKDMEHLRRRYCQGNAE